MSLPTHKRFNEQWHPGSPSVPQACSSSSFWRPAWLGMPFGCLSRIPPNIFACRDARIWHKDRSTRILSEWIIFISYIYIYIYYIWLFRDDIISHIWWCTHVLKLVCATTVASFPSILEREKSPAATVGGHEKALRELLEALQWKSSLVHPLIIWDSGSCLDLHSWIENLTYRKWMFNNPIL